MLKHAPEEFPDFVQFGEWDGTGYDLLILGQLYKMHSSDFYMEDAIFLAGRWNIEEVSYQRIVHLRNWLRENVQHGHNLPFSTLNSLKACKIFVDILIDKEYKARLIPFTKANSEQKSRLKELQTRYANVIKENAKVFDDQVAPIDNEEWLF